MTGLLRGYVPAHVTLIWRYLNGSSLGVGITLPLYSYPKRILINEKKARNYKIPLETFPTIEEALRLLRNIFPNLADLSYTTEIESQVPLGCGLASSASRTLAYLLPLAELGFISEGDLLRVTYQAEVNAKTGVADVIILWRTLTSNLIPPILAWRISPWRSPLDAKLSFSKLPNAFTLVNPIKSPTEKLFDPKRLEEINRVGEMAFSKALNYLKPQLSYSDLVALFRISAEFSEVAYPEGVEYYKPVIKEIEALGVPYTFKKRTLLAISSDRGNLEALKELLERRGLSSETMRIIELESKEGLREIAGKVI